MKWPPPIQWVNTFDQRIQNFEDKLDEALTADHYNLLTMVYVGWKIKDAQEFFPRFKNGSIAEAERQMEGLLRSAKSAVVGKHPLSDFVSTDEKLLKFDAVEQEILAILQDQVNKKNYGIEIEYLGIKKLEFPESVTQGGFQAHDVRPQEIDFQDGIRRRGGSLPHPVHGGQQERHDAGGRQFRRPENQGRSAEEGRRVFCHF